MGTPRTLLVFLVAALSPAAAAGADLSDPAGCFELLSPDLIVSVFRADGTTGVVGHVSECETLHYQVAVDSASTPTACAVFGGRVELETPDGAVHELHADVPCVGGNGDNGSGCAPGMDGAVLPRVQYRVRPEDAVGGLLTARVRYDGWGIHSTVGPLDGIALAATETVPMIVCADADPCTSDLCDPEGTSAQACTNPTNPFGCFVCGDGAVQPGEACDTAGANGRPGSCCSFDCALRAAGDECRPSAGACDVPEACDGASGPCPPDGKRPAGTECRPADGPCDLPEACDGADAACPDADAIAVEQVCRPAVDACDVAEQCDGVAKECPADARSVAGTPCGAGDSCDGAGQCVDTCGNGVPEPWESCDLPARSAGQWCTTTCQSVPCDWRSVAEARPATADGAAFLCSLAGAVAGADCDGERRVLAKANALREATRRRAQALRDGGCRNARAVARKMRGLVRRLARVSGGLRFGACTSQVVGPAVLTWADLAKALAESPDRLCAGEAS